MYVYIYIYIYMNIYIYTYIHIHIYISPRSLARPGEGTAPRHARSLGVLLIRLLLLLIIIIIIIQIIIIVVIITSLVRIIIILLIIVGAEVLRSSGGPTLRPRSFAYRHRTPFFDPLSNDHTNHNYYKYIIPFRNRLSILRST